MNHTTALLVIDVQVGIVEGTPDHPNPVYAKESLVQTIQALIDHARTRSIPVLYVQDLDVKEAGEEAFAIHPALSPAPHEPIIYKRATDSFHGTDLHEQLQALGIKHLVIVGCKTEYCVDSACRKATTLGYDVTLVRDGHSTTDNAALHAEQIIAHHNTCLHGLSNLDPFILVRPSEEDVLVPSHDSYR
ncbi:cysteine hydrolase family protein [Brevibacillus choshinensis]|uniref:cysteine hydrolase family protein n=1 Tax=Brevibacillus choshinensis TaxID=54911 RepID=UPI002E248696|nr:cysteine hydrolase family protein [Brevibacillus choshinensis]MED4783828.1 cysteine hydrolase family protein [Brevibacillus choshinensis]